MKRLWLVSAIVCVSVSWATSAHADAVTYWNAVTVDAVTAGRPGGAGFLDMALVHAAMHDAVQAIQPRFEPYAAKLKGSGSPEAAAGAAAYGVLVGIYPKQQGVFDAKYKEFLASGGLAGNAGLAVGQQAAAALLKHHRLSTALPDYKGASTPGAWRPTPSFIGSPPQPPEFAPMAYLYMAETKPYTLERPSQFRPEAPPALTSSAYLRDYNEVKALGALGSTKRTPAQTDLAYFWGGNFVSQWNGALRSIVDARKMDLGDSARLFALASLAAADAAITCWDSKRHFSFWRPVTAIREAENDGNAETVPDKAWEPLINTPNYPDYTSGANSVTAAITTILERFFGTDEFTFTVTTDVPLAKQKARSFKRFSEAAAEVVEARILLGIHFRFADVVARTQGTQVANWTFSHALRPLKK
jgi:PAP2 superfamily